MTAMIKESDLRNQKSICGGYLKLMEADRDKLDKLESKMNRCGRAKRVNKLQKRYDIWMNHFNMLQKLSEEAQDKFEEMKAEYDYWKIG